MGETIPKGSFITRTRRGFIEVYEALKPYKVRETYDCGVLSGVIEFHFHPEDRLPCKHGYTDLYRLTPQFKQMRDELRMIVKLSKTSPKKPQAVYPRLRRHHQAFYKKYAAVVAFLECTSYPFHQLHYLPLVEKRDRDQFVGLLHDLSIVRYRQPLGGRTKGDLNPGWESIAFAIESQIKAGKKVERAVSDVARSHNIPERSAWRYRTRYRSLTKTPTQ